MRSVSVRPSKRLITVTFLATLMAGCARREEAGLSDEDAAAVRAVEAAYVDSWIRNDQVAVLELLDPDAALLPGGLEPVTGLERIREFWWPVDGPATTVTAYSTTVDEIGGSGRLAWVRGRGSLSFTLQDPTGEARLQSSRNVFLMVLRKDANERWLILQRMWANLPGA